MSFEEKEKLCGALRWYTLKTMNFDGAIVLAPMVRVSTHPMRLLALRYGATYVYTEEIIDYKLLRTTRLENKKLGTVDYVYDDGSIVFRTSTEEKGKVVLQLGTADAKRALMAAQKVQGDVAAIDVNMGCPKYYSIKGGMGAALLRNPEKIKTILTKLVQFLRVPVTCKIRILSTMEETLSLVRLIDSTGVAAIAVHGRTREERPRDPNHDDVIRAISQAIKTPILANGGSRDTIRLYEDIEFFRQATGAAGVMIARAAMWNPAIFAPPPLDAPPPSDVQLVREYLQLAVKYDHHISGTKICIQRMFSGKTGLAEYVKTGSVETMAELCEIWSLPQEVIESAKLCSDDRVSVLAEISTNESFLQGKKPRLEEEEAKDGSEVLTLPLGFVRHEWPEVGDLPKQILMRHCKRKQIDFPTYSTVENKASRTFSSIVTLNGASYAHKIASTTKRFAEQAAALACLTHLGIWPPTQTNEKNS
ncbi:tRNA-dihydrouridine synthase 2-like protein [Echinococcus granulosus]|uniref:tRNA-dihydrouridine synthase 2-like protein n=2 Tax=Echinococcus granulosus TaxID=6210 RepID=W6UBE6_ECHGR|nr:tRNA-dihydrouridine synthase 2-like protein [Echinococcus granulosus]EUB55767.1 tRNA-dihydrouridine synthase 2-like protein [Echinococcus granulosus]